MKIWLVKMREIFHGHRMSCFLTMWIRSMAIINKRVQILMKVQVSLLRILCVLFGHYLIDMILTEVISCIVHVLTNLQETMISNTSVKTK